jgi:hypothetical protein
MTALTRALATRCAQVVFLLLLLIARYRIPAVSAR